LSSLFSTSVLQFVLKLKMDISNYIASGVLELYVNGLLSEPEKREVEALAAQYPEIKQEIFHIEEALEAYAMAHRKTPKR
jgi:hypothetical protein